MSNQSPKLKAIADHISNEMLKEVKAPPADEFDEDKYPYGHAADHDHCMTCGKPPTDTPRGKAFLFKDYISAKEYGISGMCQACQDGFFHE